MVNLGNSSCQAARENQVSEEMAKLDKVIALCAETRSRLENRLSTVSHPQEVEKCLNETQCPTPPTPKVILASQLSDFCNRINQIIRADEDLLTRLEL